MHVMDKRFEGSGEKIMTMLDTVGDKTLAFLRKECKEHIVSVDINLMMSFTNLLDSLLRAEYGVKDDNLDLMLSKFFVFSYIWSLGGNLHDTSHKKFEEFARMTIAEL
eukprot:792127-Rhodomonas_salina.1